MHAMIRTCYITLNFAYMTWACYITLNVACMPYFKHLAPPCLKLIIYITNLQVYLSWSSIELLKLLTIKTLGILIRNITCKHTYSKHVYVNTKGVLHATLCHFKRVDLIFMISRLCLFLKYAIFLWYFYNYFFFSFELWKPM